MDQQVNGYCWELCWLVYDSLVCFLAAMVFLHLTLAMGAVAWPLTGKQSRNFRGEELSNKRLELLSSKETRKALLPLFFFFFSASCTKLLTSVWKEEKLGNKRWNCLRVYTGACILWKSWLFRALKYPQMSKM